MFFPFLKFYLSCYYPSTFDFKVVFLLVSINILMLMIITETVLLFYSSTTTKAGLLGKASTSCGFLKPKWFHTSWILIIWCIANLLDICTTEYQLWQVLSAIWSLCESGKIKFLDPSWLTRQHWSRSRLFTVFRFYLFNFMFFKLRSFAIFSLFLICYIICFLLCLKYRVVFSALSNIIINIWMYSYKAWYSYAHLR